jgi:hypothetical protein
MYDLRKLKAEYDSIRKHQSSDRFKRVMGRLIALKLILPNSSIRPIRKKLSILDYIWSGKYEPRILELLPALVLKRPSLFTDLEKCPSDLQEVLRDIKKGDPTKDFRGIPSQSYVRWIPLIGHKGVQVSQVKSFRLKQEELILLRELKKCGFSESEAVREGLKLLHAKSSSQGD